ncbi:MAG: extracellular solute-binding protein [Firmicutes bacterium]|nr:extracellular solute-binding protein [Bacillota bacterium]
MRSVGSVRILATAILISMLVGVAGAVASARTTLTVGVFPDLDSVLKAGIPEFNKVYPDIEINLQTLGFADHHNALLTALATGSGAPDVVAIEIGYLGRFAVEGGLTDLSRPPYNAGELKDLFVPFAWGQATTTDGRIVAIPTDIGPGTMFYRRDVLEAAGVDIDAVATWDHLVEMGRKVTRDLNGDGKPDVFLIAAASTIADAMYRGDIPEGEGVYFDARGRTVVDSPRFVNAFTVAQRVRQAGLDARIGAWSNEWYEAFKRGTVAVELSGAWLGGHLQNWMAPETAGKWGARDLPSNMYVSWGGSFYAIPEQSRNKDAAWKLIQFLTTRPEIQILAFRTTNAFPALQAALEDPLFDEPVPFLAGQRARRMWAEAAAKVHVSVIHPGDPVAQEIVGSALTQVLEEGKDVRQALAEARQLIERRVRR